MDYSNQPIYKEPLDRFMKTISVQGMTTFISKIDNISNYANNPTSMVGVYYVLSSLLGSPLEEKDMLLDIGRMCDIFSHDIRMCVVLKIGEWFIYADGINKLELVPVEDYLKDHQAEIWTSTDLSFYRKHWNRGFQS